MARRYKQPILEISDMLGTDLKPDQSSRYHIRQLLYILLISATGGRATCQGEFNGTFTANLVNLDKGNNVQS